MENIKEPKSRTITHMENSVVWLPLVFLKKIGKGNRRTHFFQVTESFHVLGIKQRIQLIEFKERTFLFSAGSVSYICHGILLRHFNPVETNSIYSGCAHNTEN